MSTPTITTPATRPPRRPRDLAALLRTHDHLAAQVASLRAHDLPHEEQFGALAELERVVADQHPRLSCTLTRGPWLLDTDDPHAPGRTCLVCAGQLP
ncbi:hypothetical protein GALL_284980 [mine drainage metagenome]|uniref:Uncharacterized protein n=1 Tax=mine drainage metagenome TaxID=410659 RepID=A0A1J5RJ58_9ZZZZ